MKIKQAGYNRSLRVLKQKNMLKKINCDKFYGYVNLCYFEEIKYPKFIVFRDNKINIWDNGYCWVQYFELGREYSVTAMYDKNNVLKQWYIDICKPVKVNRKGIPYFRDMYLDLVVLPSGQMEVLDEDELQEALENHHITTREYKRAYEVLEQLKDRVKKGNISEMNMSKTNLIQLKEELFAMDEQEDEGNQHEK
ncbi:hypothetical protein SAMN02745248_02358 [Hathewaya proteolytica DSM 3090]|uniref:DUF402 domain-containing protein n=1 Tax=Hathewaya proteolytica DSM 3090 TaxID=1121331 RepID=A0A1M6RSZ3_9CLOT|nr:DUF402 domain-containing protein [Hathewaya proteolytica]SHK35524.1 hypothetical protein SAMN02745248_02358 [Hathewaya proteolytica DSM 3090]